MIRFLSKLNESVAIVFHFMNWCSKELQALLFFLNLEKIMTHVVNKTFQGKGKYKIKG